MMTPPNKATFLAHWTYSREEWGRYIRWKKSRRGVWRYWLYALAKGGKVTVPEVAITNQKVWIGNEVHSFRGKEKQLKKIHIREAAHMNIIEIYFVEGPEKALQSFEISIPIPKGKLREAMEVHESLSLYVW